jgi:hypothetical protein
MYVLQSKQLQRQSRLLRAGELASCSNTQLLYPRDSSSAARTIVPSQRITPLVGLTE